MPGLPPLPGIPGLPAGPGSAAYPDYSYDYDPDLHAGSYPLYLTSREWKRPCRQSVSFSAIEFAVVP